MKLLRHLLMGASLSAAVFAQNVFPGLKSILTEAEWQRAGLDRLTPDQIGVIDAALIRHLVAERRASETAPAAVSTPPVPAPGASPAEAAAARSRFWERFGLGKSAAPDWRTLPPLTAKVTGWQGANRFVLDVGQVWEGEEMIPYEILGQTITIEARPMGAYALKLNENSVAVRVKRVK